MESKFSISFGRGSPSKKHLQLLHTLLVELSSERLSCHVTNTLSAALEFIMTWFHELGWFDNFLDGVFCVLVVM
jgi:hypothetical protein